MDLSLNGKHALVCGSSQGIGLASAIELAELGATVTLFARSEDRLRGAIVRLPTTAGQHHDLLVADFDHPENVARSVGASIDAGASFEILVNNSGGPPGGALTEATDNEFLLAFNRHLLSSQRIVQAVLPGMRSAGFGRIINIISTSVKMPLRGLGVSNTIRGAVANWAKTLSFEVASDGITVNNVLPGATETSRLSGLFSARSKASGLPETHFQEEWEKVIPAGRFAAPSEIAAAVAFLASPAAAYINGINLPVDGGRTGCL